MLNEKGKIRTNVCMMGVNYVITARGKVVNARRTAKKRNFVYFYDVFKYLHNFSVSRNKMGQGIKQYYKK